GDRLRRLVEDMLAVTHLGDGGVPVHPELVDVAALLRRAVDAVPGAADLATLRVAEDLPPVILDPEHLRRVALNLLSNAVKYAEGSPITVSAAVERDDLVVMVIDRGPGMPPESAARAFEPFEQPTRTEVDAYGGVGLGLSISRGLAESMGGTLGYRPTRGGGATFVVRLPFRPHLRPAGRS
ncbi:MAG TPA: HAMP domain-containing sensor histidine kinase, partial [Thermoanaerobaculia bacterium]|nr:HAMP domain-containing sensor histidine kinase [Thermoanaerobaculia bacterium]